MSDKISVLIVDDLPETRENVRKLLQFEPDVEVVGQAGDGSQAIELARQHKPNVILMDINMPGVDGISASQAIVQSVPQAQIVIMSVQSEADYLRRAMLAGARDFLMKPFSGDELMAAIRRVYETRPVIAAAPVQAAGGTAGAAESAVSESAGKVLAVYSPKGGSGCTTLAINMAVALAQRGHKVALVDVSLQFGDVAVTLNMRPTTTIVDLIDRINELDADLVSSVMIKHDSGLSVLLAPPRPEMAELVQAEHIEGLIDRMRQLFDFIIIDTPTALNDVALVALDNADRVMLVTQQNLASLTNARRFFDLMSELNYDIQKLMLVVNRVSDKMGISVKDVSDALKRPVISSVQADDLSVTNAADRGVPLVTTTPRRNSIASSLMKLADNVETELGGSSSPSSASGEPEPEKRKGFFKRLFGG